LAVTSGWIWMLPGLFAQAGIAEEALFRGFLYGHLRHGRSFWSAAALSTLPFMIVHLYLFATMTWPVALVALFLSALISFPLAHLYEISGRTIWAPALVHFVVQVALKVVTIAEDSALPLAWILASASVPFAAFLVERPTGYRIRIDCDGGLLAISATVGATPVARCRPLLAPRRHLSHADAFEFPVPRIEHPNVLVWTASQ
jgi:hypothetical protein